MGEAVASGEMAVDLEVNDEGSSMATVVRWEKFLPRMVLRVLLVEADDSTRQIIAALLRKCSYKVAAVSDGLKAWEVLKRRPHDIDLILTEVELPSISGFALLTLTAEHEICKNIPIIMMSSLDSVSTVYKCMLRGAADFLVKPLRKNELKNLWQHVWRRQASSSRRPEPQDESDAQQKVEATAENNATSNHSSGYTACIKRNRECIEKGSDAQSSCTKMSKPDLEAERAYEEDTEDLSQPKRTKSLSSDMKLQNQEECANANNQLLMHELEAEGSAAAASKDVNKLTAGEEMGPESLWECANVVTDAFDNNRAPVNSSREAIDLIGAFDNNPKYSYRSSGLNYGANKVDLSPLLDLSLRRCYHSNSVNQVTDDRHMLKHSDASAFSRYINKTSQPPHSTSASICNHQNDYETNSDKQLSNHPHEYNSETYGPTVNYQKNTVSPGTDQPGQGELHFPSPKHRVFPVPIPVRGVRFDSLSTPYGSVLPPIFCTQSGPGSSAPSFQVNQNSQQLHNLMEQNTNSAPEQTEHNQGRKPELLEDRGNFSSANDQSASSSFCNGGLSHLNSIGSGSNGNANLVTGIRAAAESGNDANALAHDGNNSHRSSLREAALNKFRMKRKDRCYEKKVRYESRKKLAEQRPRVKGQFVRQANNDPPPVETYNTMERA